MRQLPPWTVHELIVYQHLSTYLPHGFRKSPIEWSPGHLWNPIYDLTRKEVQKQQFLSPSSTDGAMMGDMAQETTS